MSQVELSDDEWKEYIRAIHLFNSKYFWECHEALEDIWMTKEGATKLFLQGIIQAAAAFYHVLNENPNGVLKLSQDSMNKLKPLAPQFLQLNLKGLIESLENFKSQAQEILNKSKTDFILSQIPLLTLSEGHA